MLRGIFINNKSAKDSIHESGMMTFQCLESSTYYTLDYIEIDRDNREIPLAYDFYFFNYHDVTMSWLDTSQLKKNLPCAITMILEVLPGDAFVRMPENDFHFYCALDPTLKRRNNLYPFPRPLEAIRVLNPIPQHSIPVIGSFGFATRGKGFEHVIEAVNKEFDQAVVRINIPHGDFVPNSKEYSEQLAELCRGLAKPGIDVQITHDFMSKKELINWCSQNDLNCYLYDRDFPGLAATTDQAIITEQPLSVSNNPTFRHVTAYLPPYPEFSLRDSMNKSVPLVKQMKEAWSPENFRNRFEVLLTENKIGVRHGAKENSYLLPLSKPGSIQSTIRLRIKKYRRRIKKFFQYRTIISTLHKT